MTPATTLPLRNLSPGASEQHPVPAVPQGLLGQLRPACCSHSLAFLRRASLQPTQ